MLGFLSSTDDIERSTITSKNYGLANERLSDKIGENIQHIRDILRNRSTKSVLRQCMNKHYVRSSYYRGLIAPTKQMFFLLGILLESAEPTDAREFRAEDWEEIEESLNQLFLGYMELYVPNDGPLAEQSEEWIKAREVAMLAFLHYFHSPLLASAEQVADQIRSYLVPFDDYLSDRFGISASDALEITLAIDCSLQDSLKELVAGVIEPILRVGKVSYSSLIDRHGSKGEHFWELFTIGRGEGHKIIYPNERSIVEDRPLIRLSDDLTVCFDLTALHSSILIRGENCLSSGRIREKFFRHRDKVLESRAASIFSRILGKEAQVYQNLYETPDKQNEHDIVAVTNDICLFIETKASRPDEPFRDPDKSYIRLLRAFRSDAGIQKAYEQTVRLLKSLKTGNTVVLYDQKGHDVLHLSPSMADKAFCVCVTRDSFGPLATRPSFLLDKGENDPDPWVVNILDLVNIAEAWEYFRWDSRQFKSFVLQRIQVNSYIFSDDELAYIGAFIRHCGLPRKRDPNVEIILGSDYAKIFEDIYGHLHYGQPPVKINPVYPASETGPEKGELEGRVQVKPNETCPCGSTAKFKRCHGR